MKVNTLKPKVAKKRVVKIPKASPQKQKQECGCACSEGDLQEAIQLKAYELFVQRGYQHGYDAEDWFTAEKMVKENQK